MALTLAELQEMTAPGLSAMVVDETRRTNWLLNNLTFDLASYGNGGTWDYSYRRVTTKPTAATRALNADYTPDEAKVTKFNNELKILGGNFEIDRASVGKQYGQDNIAFQVSQKIEALSALFGNLLINGDEGGDATQFDGLATALASSSTEVTPDAAIDLSDMSAIDTNYAALRYWMRQLFKTMDKRPTALLCNRDFYAVAQSVSDKFAANTETRDSFGNIVTTFMGIPLIDLGEQEGSSDPIIATATATGYTDIYAVYLGLDGLHGVVPSDTGKAISVYLPKWADGDDSAAVKTGAVEMITTVALKATRAAAVLHEVQVAPAAP